MLTRILNTIFTIKMVKRLVDLKPLQCMLKGLFLCAVNSSTE
jgi:hypothetical protein